MDTQWNLAIDWSLGVGVGEVVWIPRLGKKSHFQKITQVRFDLIFTKLFFIFKMFLNTQIEDTKTQTPALRKRRVTQIQAFV